MSVERLLDAAYGLLARARRGCAMRGESGRGRALDQAMHQVARAEGWLGIQTSWMQEIEHPADVLDELRADLAGDTASERINAALEHLAEALDLAATAALRHELEGALHWASVAANPAAGRGERQAGPPRCDHGADPTPRGRQPAPGRQDAAQCSEAREGWRFHCPCCGAALEVSAAAASGKGVRA